VDLGLVGENPIDENINPLGKGKECTLKMKRSSLADRRTVVKKPTHKTRGVL
jgi:hypothetical protein